MPSFPRQVFYKTPNGSIIPDPHYNQAEYYHFLAEIENKIIDNYFIRDLMIDLYYRWYLEQEKFAFHPSIYDCLLERNIL